MINAGEYWGLRESGSLARFFKLERFGCRTLLGHGPTTLTLCLSRPLQADLRPDLRKGVHQMVDVGIGVQGGRSDAEALGAPGYRRIVDRLDVDAVVVEQPVA